MRFTLAKLTDRLRTQLKHLLPFSSMVFSIANEQSIRISISKVIGFDILIMRGNDYLIFFSFEHEEYLSATMQINTNDVIKSNTIKWYVI
jgi:hypothetical protein